MNDMIEVPVTVLLVVALGGLVVGWIVASIYFSQIAAKKAEWFDRLTGSWMEVGDQFVRYRERLAELGELPLKHRTYPGHRSLLHPDLGALCAEVRANASSGFSLKEVLEDTFSISQFSPPTSLDPPPASPQPPAAPVVASKGAGAESKGSPRHRLTPGGIDWIIVSLEKLSGLPELSVTSIHVVPSLRDAIAMTDSLKEQGTEGLVVRPSLHTSVKIDRTPDGVISNISLLGAGEGKYCVVVLG